jgi:hypothetical protein
MRKTYFGFIVGLVSFACGESSGDSGSVGATGGDTAAGASGAGVGGNGVPAGSGGGSTSGAAGALQGGSATSGGTKGGAGAHQGDAGSGAMSGSGTAGAGDAAGAGGSGTAGASGGSSTKPSGSVETCFGSSCPMGECDNALFFADIACTENWPPPLGPSTPYCPSGLNAGYCLTVQSSALEDWSVVCSNGAPRLRKCPAGCATSEDTSWCL